ncbi:reverse transcriptase domain-containing protein [Merismopedia glauca]|uniref:Group II intron reverse transcriptase/maturase n=1 Tax=Merismopedia glauca CCAP 1448/3 TaxID=1296344 RepID=A0A2T1C1E8_9CYAN|nr:reverse transcriptase domain-containing protein [Merismopedia glauca]PSB02100.1 group II intron reverse transcriptase/maturase [Merismopedia glauca CCAP 1448/3]
MTLIADEFLSLPNFRQAWIKVANNQGCAGIDGETIEEFAKNSELFVTQLLNSVINETYQPLPCKSALIPKNKDKWRELRIPTVRDRIVQQALLNVIYSVTEKKFAEASFAYRPNLSYLDAVQKVASWRDLDYQWVLDADIVEYFDNIEHHRLLESVKKYISNTGILSLIKGWISVGTLTNRGLVVATKGIPQGAVISPLLANIYLDEFDKSISESNVKLIRYADDFVILAKDEDSIMLAYAKVIRLLKSLGLELNEQKTQITTFQRGFQFLGHGFLDRSVFPVDSATKSSKKKVSHPRSNLTKQSH